MKERGITLIELTVVLVILAILVAIPVARYYSNTVSEAKQKATDGVANTLNIASQKNYALSRVGSSRAVTVTNCQNVESALSGSTPLPSGYTITSTAISAGSSVSCTVTNTDNGTTATFIGWGVAAS